MCPFPSAIQSMFLSCLFYADDVVLFFSSATGLQTSLNIFQQYCKNWKLSINLKKIKIMIFEKRSRKSTLEKYSIFIDNDPIDISQDCSLYFGLSVCANGNFSNSKRILLEKCRRCVFATKSFLDFP